MRYIIETKDEEGLIGIQISKWAKEKKLEIIEKAEPLVEIQAHLEKVAKALDILKVEIQAHLEKVAKALDILKKAGYNSQVMKSFLYEQTHISKTEIATLLKSQEDFFRQIGVLK